MKLVGGNPDISRPFTRAEALDILAQCTAILDSLERLVELAKQSLEGPDLQIAGEKGLDTQEGPTGD